MNRKICLTLIALLLAALLAGCGSAGSAPSTAAPEITAAPEPTAAAPEAAGAETGETPAPEPSPEPVRAASVEFDHGYDKGAESARITGRARTGEELWTVLTGTYPAAQLDLCTGIGMENGLYYYAENGRIVALDLTDGATVWENADFGGSATGWVFDNDGNLFICGYFGPDLCVIDPDGNTLDRVGRFDPECIWPYRLELEGDALQITYEMDDRTLSVPLKDLPAWEKGENVLSVSYDRDWVLSEDGLSQLRILAVKGHEVTFGVSFYRLAAFTAVVELDDALHTGAFASADEMEFSGWITFEDRTVTFTVGAAGPFNDDLQGKTCVFVPMTEEDGFTVTAEELNSTIDWIRQHYYHPGEGDQTVTIHAGDDGWEYSRQYRFYNGELIFAFVFKGTEEHRLYYKDGHLIRFIDELHVTYDFGNLDPFTEWDARVRADAAMHHP